jgi:ATP-dependent exoDNAse (exonuclease V) beta subunit
VRYGVRRLKYGASQRYMCKKCGKIFTDRKLKHRSYPPKIVLNAISYYNLGHTLEQTRKEISRRFRHAVPPTTIHSWVKYYSKLCTFSRLREEAARMFSPEEMLLAQNFDHGQVYAFRLHKAKLELLSKELPGQKSSLLKAYLEKIPTKDFPHHIFRMGGEGMEKRASQMEMQTLDFIRIRKENRANVLAGLALRLAKTNKERHETIQKFMLANDSVTIAAEVPVYLTADDIEYFKGKGFTLNFENYRTPVTGHIDVLQIRNGLIHILDYKPEANKTNAASQLTIYALALASRTKLAVKDFKCAWFDEKNYYEFFPLHAVYGKQLI